MFGHLRGARSALRLGAAPLLLAACLGAAPADAEPAVLTLHVPAGSIVRFDGVETEQDGLTRRFETPPLVPGRTYSYDVSVSWIGAAGAVVRQRRVVIRAGEHVTLNFGPSVLLGGGGEDLLTDPAAPDPSGTAYYEDPLNWPVYPLRPPSPPAAPAGRPAQARIRVLVPADAEVLFDAEPTTQKGTERDFLTPPLAAGKKYHYDLVARWKENGETIEHTHRVEVSGGTTVRVDFRTPVPERRAKRSKE
jgi:uncharacterized protein (TIGR03000 family)